MANANTNTGKSENNLPAPMHTKAPAATPRSSIRKHLALIIVPAVLLLAFNLRGHTSATEDADALLRQAEIAAMKARRESCKNVAARVTACFTGGDAEACAQLRESNTWFTQKFGKTPEMACQENDPF